MLTLLFKLLPFRKNTIYYIVQAIAGGVNQIYLQNPLSVFAILGIIRINFCLVLFGFVCNKRNEYTEARKGTLLYPWVHTRGFFIAWRYS